MGENTLAKGDVARRVSTKAAEERDTPPYV
jgi:hypothetical protein